MKKRTAPLWIGIAVIAVITVAVTVYSASLTGRWGTFPGMEESRAAIKALPMTIGKWQAEEERQLRESDEAMLKIQNSYIFRTYKNLDTQEVVHLTLMVGPSGVITVHTPEICFGGRDYEKESRPVRVPFSVELAPGEEKVDDTFWRLNFTGRSMDVNNQISFYYAVSTGDVWQAVENTRSHFRAYRYVYKLQAEAYSGFGETGDIVKHFLDDCLPTIHEHLRSCYTARPL